MRSSKSPEPRRQRRLAISGEAWYLVNLLLLPGIGFAVQVVLWRRHRHRSPGPGLERLRRSWVTSLAAGGAVAGVTALAWLLFGFTPAGWAALLLGVICVHTGFVLLGLLRLAEALNLRD